MQNIHILAPFLSWTLCLVCVGIGLSALWKTESNHHEGYEVLAFFSFIAAVLAAVATIVMAWNI